MKIFFLIRSLDVGGAERQLLLLSRGLALRGHQVTICVFYAGKMDSEVSPDVKLIHMQKKNRWQQLSFFWRLRRAVKAFGPDVIHGFLLIPNIYCALLKFFFPRVKVVWGLRSSNILEGHYGRWDRWAFYFSALLSSVPDLIISNSETGKKYHQKYYRNHNFISIPNGIDPVRFSLRVDEGARLRQEWGVGADEVLIGNVGRLSEIKDHPLFLRTLSELHRRGLRFKAVCIGHGSENYRQSLAKLSEELGVQDLVLWIDHMDQMSGAYSAFDLTVLCSKSESFPNVVFESMACGTPCVVTSTAGDAEIMVGRYGIAAAADPKSLSEACLQLLEKKKSWTREELSASIRTKYNQDALFEKTEKVLQS